MSVGACVLCVAGREAAGAWTSTGSLDDLCAHSGPVPSPLFFSFTIPTSAYHRHEAETDLAHNLFSLHRLHGGRGGRPNCC